VKQSDVVDRVMSVCAIVAATAAVAVSVYEARIDRAHQRVSVWPYLGQSNSLTAGSPYRRTVSNVGIGPARIRSFQVRVDGTVRRGWPEVVRALTGDSASGRIVYSSLGRGDVLLPGQTLELLTLPPGATATAFWREAQGDRLSTRICYCSLYDECWLAESGAGEPRPARACPTNAPDEFAQ